MAIEQDSNFFSAYFYKALSYDIFGNKEKYAAAAKKALACDIKLNKAEKVSKEIMEAQLADFEADLTPIAYQYIDNYPDVAESYQSLSYYCAKVEDYESAVENAKKAIELDPDNPGHILNLGYYLISLEQFEEAEKAFDKYMELLPDAPNVYDSRGDLYMAAGEYDKAYENFMKAHELGWGDAKALKAKKMLQHPSPISVFHQLDPAPFKTTISLRWFY